MSIRLGVCLALCLALCLPTACGPLREAATARDEAVALAAGAGFAPMTLDESGLRLAAFAKNGPGKALVVYIEGDGRAWADRRTPSADPTPRDPLVLRLALLDPAPKVLYLARPCQFTPENAPFCDHRLWTSDRYGPQVVDSLNRALDQAKAALGADRLHLVGYSGGGALAVLTAAKRRDVADILTLAANLDTTAWTAHHRISPLSGSLNPADFARAVAAIPQTHLCGDKDAVVPPFLCARYLDRSGPGSLARCQRIDAGHGRGALDRWRDLLASHRRFAASQGAPQP